MEEKIARLEERIAELQERITCLEKCMLCEEGIINIPDDEAEQLLANLSGHYFRQLLSDEIKAMLAKGDVKVIKLEELEKLAEEET